MSTFKNSLLVITSFLFGFLGVYTANIVSAHGGDTNRIHACVNNSSGEIKIVDANAMCKNNQTPLDWNIQGLASPIHVTIRTGNSKDGGIAKAFCLPGEKVLGGGFSNLKSIPFDSYPSNSLIDNNGNTVEGWGVTSNGYTDLIAYATCAAP